MRPATRTYLHAYTADGQCMATFAITAIDGHISYGHLAWLSTLVEPCSYLKSLDHCRISAETAGMSAYFLAPHRCNGDAAPDRLIDALNGELTMPVGGAVVADKCTCGTSRTPSGGRHNDYCDGFAGQGCAGIVDGSRRCSCCV